MGGCCENEGFSRRKEGEIIVANSSDEIIIQKGVKPIEYEKLSKAIKDSQLAVKRIVKLQAWIKGIRTRKLYPTLGSIKPITIIKYISDKIAGVTEAVINTEKRLGPYILEWDAAGHIKGQVSTLELRKQVTEQSGETYCGYWNKETNTKEGYGQQLFQNGAKYEGMWKNNLPEGLGRYIYENGDYYYGNRIQGKANGEGTFVSTEGNTYTGYWQDDMHHGKGKDDPAE